MIEIAFSALLYYCAGLLFLGLMGTRFSLKTLVTSTVACVFLIVLASANFEYEIIDQKFASEFAFTIYSGEQAERSTSGFVLQYVYCLPAFIITNAWWSAIGTNIAAVVLVFVVVAARNYTLAFAVFAPAVINFAIFSLRDPLIGVLFFFIALTMTTPDLTKKWGSQALSAIAFIFVRPENIAILASAHGVALARKYRRKVWLPFFLIFFAGLAVVVLPYVPRLLGLSFSGSIFDLPLAISNFYEARATRWGEELGGGSNILDGRLPEYSFLTRYPIQITSFFILPLPMDLNSPQLGLATIDSVIFCWLTWKFHKSAPTPVIILFWCYVMMTALFMNNYGNAFRIRMPAYFIMIAGMYRR